MMESKNRSTPVPGLAEKSPNQAPSKVTPEHYNRVLDRLVKGLESAEHTSWDTLQKGIEEAVELELAAEEMTQDELSLLSAYLQRDLKHLGYYAHETGEGIARWLNFDLNILEQTLADRLVALADQTRLDQERLREQLALDENQYMAGEVATAGTFECLTCHRATQVTKTSHLQPCEACHAEWFKRQYAESDRNPDQA